MTCQFEVEIALGPGPGDYRVNVLESPAGEASGELRLDVQELLARRGELQAAVLASAVTVRAAIPETERPIREVGQQLFKALFVDSVYGRYTASLAAAAERGEQLRVVLRLQTAELAALPWETLFDLEHGSYVCQTEPLLRYVSMPRQVDRQHVSAPLRVLGVIAAPNDLPTLDVADEQRRMAAALGDVSEEVEVAWVTGGRWTDLQHMLLAGPWHVLHFIGHGGFRGGEGMLAMVGPTGTAKYVSAAQFTSLLSTAVPSPRLVVLNSCSSGEAGDQDLFSSTAAALVRSGVSAVVAMQFAVSDPAASAFTGGFYAAIAHNRTIGEAVRIGRIAIHGTGDRTLEWVTPVLYLRGEDKPLFDVVEAGTGVPVTAPTGETVEQAARAATLLGLYTQAQAELRLGHDAEAAVLLDQLVALDPDYRDAVELRDATLRRQLPVSQPDHHEDRDRLGKRNGALGSPKVRRLLLAALGVAVALTLALLAFSPDHPPPVVADDPPPVIAAKIRVSDKPLNVAVTQDAIWVSHATGGRLSRIDRKNNEVRFSDIPNGALGDIVSGLGYLWVGGDNALIKVDNSGGVVATIRLPTQPVDLAVGKGHVWFSGKNGNIGRVDPVTNQFETIKTLAVSQRYTLADIEVGNITEGSCQGERVFVSHPDLQDPYIQVIDPDDKTGPIFRGPDITNPIGLAVEHDSLWVTNAQSGRVSHVDACSGTVRGTAPIGESSEPWGVALGSGAVWTANRGNGTVTRINPETRAVSDPRNVGAKPDGIAVADEYVWVASTETDEVVSIRAR